MRTYDAQKCSVARQLTRVWNSHCASFALFAHRRCFHPLFYHSVCFCSLLLPRVSSKMGKRVRFRCGLKNICINNKTTVLLFHELLSVFWNMMAKCGQSLPVAVGRAQAGDQSELEPLMITQLYGESSDSCCSGIDALLNQVHAPGGHRLCAKSSEIWRIPRKWKNTKEATGLDRLYNLTSPRAALPGEFLLGSDFTIQYDATIELLCTCLPFHVWMVLLKHTWFCTMLQWRAETVL